MCRKVHCGTCRAIRWRESILRSSLTWRVQWRTRVWRHRCVHLTCLLRYSGAIAWHRSSPSRGRMDTIPSIIDCSITSFPSPCHRPVRGNSLNARHFDTQVRYLHSGRAVLTLQIILLARWQGQGCVSIVLLLLLGSFRSNASGGGGDGKATPHTTANSNVCFSNFTMWRAPGERSRTVVENGGTRDLKVAQQQQQQRNVSAVMMLGLDKTADSRTAHLGSLPHVTEPACGLGQSLNVPDGVSMTTAKRRRSSLPSLTELQCPTTLQYWFDERNAYKQRWILTDLNVVFSHWLYDVNSVAIAIVNEFLYQYYMDELLLEQQATVNCSCKYMTSHNNVQYAKFSLLCTVHILFAISPNVTSFSLLLILKRVLICINAPKYLNFYLKKSSSSILQPLPHVWLT